MSFLKIPNISYPFKGETGPHAAAVDDLVFRWGRQHGLCGEERLAWYQALSIGYLASRAYPRAELSNLLLLGNRFLWLFTFDDRYCDESERDYSSESMIQIVGRLIGILDGTPHSRPKSPLEIALSDFLDQFDHKASALQRERFVATIIGYLFSSCWETANRSLSIMPSVSAYRHMRYYAGGMPTCIALVDVVNRSEVLPQEYFHPDVNKLVRLTSNIVCWSNDVLSYGKEISRGATIRTLPTVIQFHENLSISEAIRHSIALHDEAVDSYVQLSEKVRGWASAALNKFLDGLEFWMTAIWHGDCTLVDSLSRIHCWG